MQIVDSGVTSFALREFVVRMTGAELAFIGAWSFLKEHGTECSPFGPRLGGSVFRALADAFDVADDSTLRAEFVAEVERMVELIRPVSREMPELL